MDSLLQKLHQTDKGFNFHSISLLSQAPLACKSSALLSPCYYCINSVARAYHLYNTYNNKMLGRAQDPHANGAWLSKLTE